MSPARCPAVTYGGARVIIRCKHQDGHLDHRDHEAASPAEEAAFAAAARQETAMKYRPIAPSDLQTGDTYKEPWGSRRLTVLVTYPAGHLTVVEPEDEAQNRYYEPTVELLLEVPDDWHDYEPGDTRHPMEAEPLCRLCGQSKRSEAHK